MSMNVTKMLVDFEPVSCAIGGSGFVTRTDRDTNLVEGCSALASDMNQAIDLHNTT